VTTNPEIMGMEARERIRNIMELVLEHDLGRYDAPMEAWARRDPRAAKIFRRVFRRRLKFIGKAFRDLGLGEEEAEVRARLFIAYLSSQRVLLHLVSKASVHRALDRLLDIFTCPERPRS